MCDPVKPSASERSDASNDWLACPHCGSEDLCSNAWALVNDEEVEAVECNKCFSGAPLAVWNKRAHYWDKVPTVSDYFNEEDLTG